MGGDHNIFEKRCINYANDDGTTAFLRKRCINYANDDEWLFFTVEISLFDAEQIFKNNHIVYQS